MNAVWRQEGEALKRELTHKAMGCLVSAAEVGVSGEKLSNNAATLRAEEGGPSGASPESLKGGSLRLASASLLSSVAFVGRQVRLCFSPWLFAVAAALSEVEKREVMKSPDFREFFESSTKLVGRPCLRIG